jgi:hypothetical protein
MFEHDNSPLSFTTKDCGAAMPRVDYVKCVLAVGAGTPEQHRMAAGRWTPAAEHSDVKAVKIATRHLRSGAVLAESAAPAGNHLRSGDADGNAAEKVADAADVAVTVIFELALLGNEERDQERCHSLI